MRWYEKRPTKNRSSLLRSWFHFHLKHIQTSELLACRNFDRGLNYFRNLLPRNSNFEYFAVTSSPATSPSCSRWRWWPCHCSSSGWRRRLKRRARRVRRVRRIPTMSGGACSPWSPGCWWAAIVVANLPAVIWRFLLETQRGMPFLNKPSILSSIPQLIVCGLKMV